MLYKLKLIAVGLISVISLVLGFFVKRKIDEEESVINDLKAQNKIKEIEKENAEAEKEQIKESYKNKEKVKNAEIKIEKTNIKIEEEERKALLNKIDKIEHTADGERYEIKV